MFTKYARYLGASSALVASLLATGCGSPAATQLNAAGGSGTPMPAKLFYNYPLSLHETTFVKNPQGPSDDKDAGWKVTINQNADDYSSGTLQKKFAIRADWDLSNRAYGYVALNVETGELNYHVIHASTYSLDAPSRGGDIGRYQTDLAEMQYILRKANAPADALAYVQSVQDQVDREAKAEYVFLLPQEGSMQFGTLGQEQSYQVGVKAFAERDLVLSAIDCSYGVLTSQRIHVPAGSAIKAISLKFPASTNGPAYCTYDLVAKLVPTGTEGSKDSPTARTFLRFN